MSDKNSPNCNDGHYGQCARCGDEHQWYDPKGSGPVCLLLPCEDGPGENAETGALAAATWVEDRGSKPVFCWKRGEHGTEVCFLSEGGPPSLTEQTKALLREDPGANPADFGLPPEDGRPLAVLVGPDGHVGDFAKAGAAWVLTYGSAPKQRVLHDHEEGWTALVLSHGPVPLGKYAAKRVATAEWRLLLDSTEEGPAWE